jgi:hypothetical protein
MQGCRLRMQKTKNKTKKTKKNREEIMVVAED